MRNPVATQLMNYHEFKIHEGWTFIKKWHFKLKKKLWTLLLYWSYKTTQSYKKFCKHLGMSATNYEQLVDCSAN